MVNRQQLPFGAIAVGLSLFHIYNALSGAFVGIQLTSVHLAVAILLVALAGEKPSSMPSIARHVLTAAMALMALSAGYYLFSNYASLTYRIGMPDRADIIFGTLAIVSLLEATRRVVGWALPVLCLVAFAYAFLGPYLPDIVAHKGYFWEEIVEALYMTTGGIHGIPLTISATYVIVFIIFGALLKQSGGGQFFIDAASYLFGSVRGGPAKIATVASGLFGSISGVAVANVLATGTFTIPLMKKLRYRPEFAGAVEAVASTGGQMMPPVMGAGAFIMAEMLGRPYVEIALAATIPAVLYFLTLFTSVDLEARRLDLKGMPHEERRALIVNVKRGLPFVIPLVVLIYALAIERRSAIYAALLATGATILVSLARGGIRARMREFVLALRDSGQDVLVVAMATASAGVIIGILTLTGLSVRLASVLITLAQGNLFVLLVLTMLAAFVIGMGMPTVATYIVLAALLAPALAELGVNPIAAHLFIFYAGMSSMITPPVAIAAYAAAGVAGGDPIKTGFVAFRLGLPLFIVPFMFVYGPALLLQAAWYEVVLAAITALIGAVSLGAALQGYILTPLVLWERILLFLGALLLVKPGLLTDVPGVVIVAFVLWRSIRGHWRNARIASAGVITADTGIGSRRSAD